MHSTNQIIKFVLILTSVVALTLSLMYTGLKGIHDKNEAIYNKKAILAAVEDQLDKGIDELGEDELLNIFSTQIEQNVIDAKGDVITTQEVEAMGYKGGQAENVDLAKEVKKDPKDRILPFYTFTKSDGEKYYIVSVRGKGLWDDIWGNIALEKDLKTIAGVSFDHKGETPGLGAEIKDNAGWKNQFIGKTLYSKSGDFTGVTVMKGGVKNPENQVDGISGATITSVGVQKMMDNGIVLYESYFDKIKS